MLLNVAQGIVLAVLSYNLGFQINNTTGADNGLVGGVVIILLLYFLLSQLIYVLFRRWQHSMFAPRSVIQCLCSTWCSLACNNDRANMLLTAFQHALFQLIVAAAFINNTSGSTFSKSFCSAAIVLTVARIPLFVLWIMPVLFPDMSTLGRWVLRLGPAAFYCPRQQRFHLHAIVAVIVVLLAMGIGAALILGSPSSEARTVCTDLPQR